LLRVLACNRGRLLTHKALLSEVCGPGYTDDTFVIFLIGFVAIFAVLTFLTALVLAPFAQALSSHILS
jgi:K+-transporting ATPase A subunit